jgi:hypothetical protein
VIYVAALVAAVAYWNLVGIVQHTMIVEVAGEFVMIGYWDIVAWVPHFSIFPKNAE